MTEIKSLQEIFFQEDEFRVDAAALQALSDFVGRGSDEVDEVPAVAVSVRLRPVEGLGHSEPVVLRLSAVLPQGYPASGEGSSFCPVVWLEPEGGSAGFASSSVAGDDVLCAELQVAAMELAEAGEECLLPLIQSAEDLVASKARELFSEEDARCGLEEQGDEDEQLARAIFEEELARAEADAAAESATAATPAAAAAQGLPKLGRRAMFSHHIIAPSKRQAIGQWALQLRLGCVAKIGWPGLIIVEGDERNVRAYVDALSRLRWKHFVVRGEQIVEGQPGQPLDELRALPTGFEEFGTDGMSDFAARCRQHGLEELFLVCLKMSAPSATASSAGGGRKARGESEAANASQRKGRKR